jgi:hypothetical protein
MDGNQVAMNPSLVMLPDIEISTNWPQQRLMASGLP